MLYMYGHRVMLTSESMTQELVAAIDKYDIAGANELVAQYKTSLANPE